MKRRLDHPAQRGIFTVEFAFVGLMFFVVLLGVLEVARMMFARTMLEEGVRRGARLAAVCPINAGGIAARAAFAVGGGSSTILPNFTAANMRVDYLSLAGAAVANPAANTAQIQFVRVAVQNYSMPLLIPVLNLTFTPGVLTSTVPAEGLGWPAGTTC